MLSLSCDSHEEIYFFLPVLIRGLPKNTHGIFQTPIKDKLENQGMIMYENDFRFHPGGG